MDKSSRDYVRKLASLYGLKYSEQGAKGKRSFVMVSRFACLRALSSCLLTPI